MEYIAVSSAQPEVVPIGLEYYELINLDYCTCTD